MIIHNYTEKIMRAIKSPPNSQQADHGTDISLSLIDGYIPRDSLVILGGRPRTGKTSLLLDMIAKNSLPHNLTKNGTGKTPAPKKGLVYMTCRKERYVLKRWLSIATQTIVEDHESGEFSDYKMIEYTKVIDGAEFDLNFITTVEDLLPRIESDIDTYNPDYVIIDEINITGIHERIPYQTVEQLDKLISLQKKSKRLFIISATLGHEAYHRGGAHRHILEDFKSTQIESEADIALLLLRPELYGIECDEEGYSMKGVVEIETAINRYGNESETTLWHGIHEIPKLGKLRAMVS